ncbi:STAS domain-containing protein [Streptomyces sp. NPDC002990]
MTDHPLTVTRESHPAGTTVLAVGGDLDHHTARGLSQALDDTPFDSGSQLVLDLSELTYCDSTGITVLVTAYRRAEAMGSALVLAGVNPDLMRVFGIIGLDQIFTFQPTVRRAVDAQPS